MPGAHPGYPSVSHSTIIMGVERFLLQAERWPARLGTRGSELSPLLPGTFLFRWQWPLRPVSMRVGGVSLCGNVSRLCKQPVTHHIAMSLTLGLQVGRDV